MSALHRCRNAVTHYFGCIHSRIINRAQHSVAQISATHDDSFYPPVKPRRPPGDWGDLPDKVTWKWHDLQQEEAKLKSVKEKIEFSANNKYNTWIYKPTMYEREHLQFQCSTTKTVLQTPDFTRDVSLRQPSHGPYGTYEGFPDVYSSMDVSTAVKLLKPLIIEIIEMNCEIYKERSLSQTFSPWKKRKESLESANSTILFQQMLSTIIGTLSCQYPHLLRVRFDENVTVAAFWDRDGIKRVLPKNPYSDDPIVLNNSRLQANHNVNFQLKMENPLPQFRIIGSELFTRAGMCPEYNYGPRVVGLFQKSMKNEVTSGHHLGDPCEFTTLSIQLSNRLDLLKLKRKFGDEAYKIALSGIGLSTGFMSTVAQAYSQGFNTYRELTYPFTTQTIVTDGRDFLFQAYQLNTLHLWKDKLGNPVNNFCWALAPTTLYDEIEDGQVKGFNDTTLEMLLKFILLEPKKRETDLKPFVDRGTAVEVKKDVLPISVGKDKDLSYEVKEDKRKYYSDDHSLVMD